MSLAWVLAFMVVLLTGISQTLLKIGAKKSNDTNSFMAAYMNVPTFAAYTLFLIVTIFSVYALKEIPLKVFYSICSLNFVAVMVFSYIILSEQIDRYKFIAVSLIVFGVIVFNL